RQHTREGRRQRASSHSRPAPRFESLAVYLETIAIVTAARAEDRVRGEVAGFDSGQDPLAARGIREGGRIAGQHHAVAHDVRAPTRGVVEAVRVAAPARGEALGQLSGARQVGEEAANVRAEAFGVAAAEADVEVAALADAPAVALQVRREV